MLFRPFLEKGESLQSYIYKLCRKNGWHYEALKTYFSKRNVPLHSTKEHHRDSIVRHLSEVTKYGSITELVDVWRLAGHYKPYWDLARIKICPKCLDSESAIPSYWYLKNYLVCGKHHSLMQDSCSGCGTAISHDSIIDLKCECCGLDLSNIESDQCKIDRFSQQIYDLLSDKSLGINDYADVLNSDLKRAESDLSILKSIVDMLSRKSKHKRNTRRFSTVSELYEKQLLCSNVSESEESLQSELVSVITKLYSAGFYDFNYIITPIINYLYDPGCERTFDALRKILKTPQSDWPELKIGVKSLEKLFQIAAGELVKFSKTHFSDILIKSQGPPSLLVCDVARLLAVYKHQAK